MTIQFLSDGSLNPGMFREWMYKYMQERNHVRVPHIPYYPSAEPAFSPSSVGFCAKANWLEKNNSIQTHPATLHEEMSSLQRRDDGSRNQERFQEVFLWAVATGKLKGVVSVEQQLSSEFFDAMNKSYLVRGRADVVFSTESHMHIVEIKRRETFMGKLQPKQSDIDQLMMYRYMALSDYALPMHHVRMYLIISEREFYEMWRVISVTTPDKGTVIRAVSEHGETVDFDRRSALSIILENTWLPTTSEIPVTDYLNNPNGWMCCKQYPKPKVRKTKNENGDFFTPGKAKVNCPYFGLCHSESAKRFSTGLKDGRIVRLSDLPDEDDTHETEV